MQWLSGRLDDYTAAEYNVVYNTLFPSRKQRIDRYKKEEDRRRSLLAELLLRKLLQKNGIKATLLSEPDGRPRLSGCDMFVSLSHSGEMAVCVISDKSIGIDIEKISPVKSGLIGRVCTDEEAEYVGLSGDEQTVTNIKTLERFYEIWTAKEAYFKMLGTGITNLKSVNTLELEKEIIKQDGYIICIITKNRF